MAYIPTDPKLKAIQAGGNWPKVKKKFKTKSDIERDIAQFYAEQREAKKRKKRGHKA